MLDNESFQMTATIIISANCKFYTECEKEYHELDEFLLESLKDKTQVFNVFFQRDNKKKNAAKSFAKLALDSVRGAYEREDWVQCRKYIIEGTNNTVSVLIGQGAFDIIMKSYKPIFSLYKKENDLSKDGMDVLIAGAGLQAKTELLKNGLYEGTL